MATRKKTKPKKPTKPTPKAAKQDTPGIDPKFVPIVAAFASDRQVKCGRMFSSNSVLNVGGKIFAMLSRGSLVVKLPKARVDAMVSAGEGKRFDPGHGRVMKEWIVVGEGRANWIDLAREAHRFVKDGKGA